MLMESPLFSLACLHALSVIQRVLKGWVETLQSESKYVHALDDNSRQMAALSADSTVVDWSTILLLALQTAQGDKSKARTVGPTTEMWKDIHYLFDQSEKHGHFLSQQIIDTCMTEILTIFHLDSDSSTVASGDASASSSSPNDKDPQRIQGSISSLAAILDKIFSYPAYAQEIKQEYFHGQSKCTNAQFLHIQHISRSTIDSLADCLFCLLCASDLFSLFANTLVTLSQLTNEQLANPATLLTSIKPYCKFPDSFLGLYKAPASAVNILVQIVLQYPYTASSTSAAVANSKKFVATHVFPFYLSLFTLRLPDNLLTKLMSGLNTMLTRSVAMSSLHLFRDFSYKFVYAMVQPNAWPKSATIKNVMNIANHAPDMNCLHDFDLISTPWLFVCVADVQELIRFCNLVLRVSIQLPSNNALRIVEGMRTRLYQLTILS